MIEPMTHRRELGQVLYHERLVQMCVRRFDQCPSWPSWAELPQGERQEWMALGDSIRLRIVPDGFLVVPRDRVGRWIAAASKLRRFARSVVAFGGSVPEAEALTDADVEPI